MLWYTGMIVPFIQVVKVATGEVGRQVGSKVAESGFLKKKKDEQQRNEEIEMKKMN